MKDILQSIRYLNKGIDSYLKMIAKKKDFKKISIHDVRHLYNSIEDESLKHLAKKYTTLLLHTKSIASTLYRSVDNKKLKNECKKFLANVKLLEKYHDNENIGLASIALHNVILCAADKKALQELTRLTNMYDKAIQKLRKDIEIAEKKTKSRVRESLDILDEGITDIFTKVLGYVFKQMINILGKLAEGWRVLLNPLKQAITRAYNFYNKLFEMADTLAKKSFIAILTPFYKDKAQEIVDQIYPILKIGLPFLKPFLFGTSAGIMTGVFFTIYRVGFLLEDAKRKIEKADQALSILVTAKELIQLYDESMKVADEILADT